MNVMDWCARGQHDKCRREFKRFIIDPRTNRVVWLDETVECECRKRGCKCYTARKDRQKKKTVRRRKK